MKKIFSLCFALFVLVLPRIEAANISENDCALGGVKAGWHSSHHYLPEKFNETGLKEVDWLESKKDFRLDQYPQSYVIGFGAIPCERVTIDDTIQLYGVYTKQGHSANAGIFQNIFNKDPLYISAIEVLYSDKMNRNFPVLATDLKTPRGIGLLSTVENVIYAYGEPDFIKPSKTGTGELYWYYTPRSLQVRKQNENYLGACIVFYISNGVVSSIAVFNTYGYSG